MLLLLSQSLFWNNFQLAIRVFTIIAQFTQDREHRLQNANKILVLLKAKIREKQTRVELRQAQPELELEEG